MDMLRELRLADRGELGLVVGILGGYRFWPWGGASGRLVTVTKRQISAF
jgi:hypothetical protein